MRTLRRTLIRTGARQARRHPRTTLKLASVAGRHPRRTMKAVRFVRMARQAPEVARDRTVRKRARAAANCAGKATRRARKIGWPQAATDDKVLHHLMDAAQHATDTVRTAGTRSRRRGRTRRIMMGATILGASAYAGRRWTQAQATAD